MAVGVGVGDFLHYTDMKKFLKNLLLWNPWSDFEIISQEYSFGDPFQKLFAKFWFVEKTWPPWGWRLFALYWHEDILKKSSSLKPLVRIWNYFTRFILVWPFQKLFTKFWSVKKTLLPWGGGFFHCVTSKKFFKILLLWNRLSDFEIISQDCSLDGWLFSKILHKLLMCWKTWPPWGGGGGGGGTFCTILTRRNFWKIFSESSGLILK